MRTRPANQARSLLVGVSAGWFLLVVMAYFAVNKPFTSASANALIDLALTLGGWLAILALGNLIGRTLPGSLDRFASIERLALRTGLGLGLLSVLVLGLGALQLFSPAILWLVELLPLPASLYFAYRDLKSIRFSIGRPRLAMWFVVASGTAALIMALAPATAWDSLVYHLTGPKLYLEQGGLAHPIDLPYLGFPKTGSMLFVLGLSLAGSQLAQLLHLSFALLTLALIPRLAGYVAPGRAPLAAAILFAVPSMWLAAGWAYVEWMAAFWLTAGFVLMARCV